MRIACDKCDAIIETRAKVAISGTIFFTINEKCAVPMHSAGDCKGFELTLCKNCARNFLKQTVLGDKVDEIFTWPTAIAEYQLCECFRPGKLK